MSATPLPDIYSLFKDSLTAGAAVFAVYVANEGLKTWRRQLTGSNEYELSKRVLRAVYVWRDAMSTVRNRVMWASEYTTPDGDETLTPQELNFAGIAGAYERRWKGLSDARVALENELLETEVLWDSSVKDTCRDLWRLQAELLAYLESYLTIRNPRTTHEDRLTQEQVLKAERRCLYESPQRDGGFTKDVNAVVAKIESLLKPHLRRDA